MLRCARCSVRDAVVRGDQRALALLAFAGQDEAPVPRCNRFLKAGAVLPPLGAGNKGRARRCGARGKDGMVFCSCLPRVLVKENQRLETGMIYFFAGHVLKFTYDVALSSLQGRP